VYREDQATITTALRERVGVGASGSGGGRVPTHQGRGRSHTATPEADRRHPPGAAKVISDRLQVVTLEKPETDPLAAGLARP
jgi:hypothetical protein